MKRSSKRRAKKAGALHNHQAKMGVTTAAVSGFSAKRPVLRGVAIFCVVMGAFYAFEFTKIANGSIRHSYLALTARVSGSVLSVLGHDTTVEGVMIKSPRFGMRIVRGCDATDPTAAFVAAVLASPAAFSAMLPGIVVGTLALLLTNLLRIVSLFLVGVHFPDAFAMMHRGFWEAMFFVLAVACWAIWIQWATRRRVPEPDGCT